LSSEHARRSLNPHARSILKDELDAEPFTYVEQNPPITSLFRTMNGACRIGLLCPTRLGARGKEIEPAMSALELELDVARARVGPDIGAAARGPGSAATAGAIVASSAARPSSAAGAARAPTATASLVAV
jgi:hypothetical protein